MLNLFWADEDGLPPGDRGLAYGDGLFETIRMEAGRGALLSRHLERMTRDAGRLGIPVSRLDLQGFCARAVDRFAGRFGHAPWILKLTLTRGQGGRGYKPAAAMKPNLVIAATELPPAPPEGGVSVDFSPVMLTVNPLFSGIKSLNRLEQVMAARTMDASLFELIMSDRDGHPVEGTRTNLLLRQGDGWVTPPASTLAVAGVMRQWVLERLRERGERVIERPMMLADLTGPECRGLYLLNSVFGVVGVRNLAGEDLPVDSQLATICDLHETLE